jgi:iron(III) transport system ATP-binding protein
MSVIELRTVAKRFGGTPVLTDVDLAVPSGSITAVLGPSGSGKTTLLRLIAGFERLDSGTITIGGRTVDDGERTVRPQHRGVGYVPQDDALFPHLTVRANIGFGLPRRERATASALLDLVGLAGLERRYPHQLSGGQQQRVALARALAIRPSVVLLDEPFGSLDASLRVLVRRDIARILAETSATAILVTHDQDEALALADQIAVLDEGRIVACADPRTLYRNPPDLTAATSIGDANLLDAHAHGAVATCALGTLRVRDDGRPPPQGRCRLLLRPEQILLHREQRPGAVRAVVLDVQYHGHDALAHVKLDDPDGETLLARVSGDSAAATGETVWLEVAGAVHAWPLGERPPG